MPVEFDDLGLRIIGVETKGLKFYDNSLALQAEIYLQADGTLNIEGVSGDGGVSGDSVVDAMYLVLSAHDDLANARVLVAGNGLSQLDSGAGNNYTLSVGAGTGITVGAAGVAVDQTFAPTWSGIHTFTAATAIQDTLTSQSIVPSATDAYDLGTSSKLFRKAYISEIEAFIFAENTISLIGGWLVVPHGQGSLPADLTAIADTCDFGTVMTVDDFVEMRAFGQVEYFLVGDNVAGTVYKIGLDASGDRDLDGSGANAWPAGTVFSVLGQDGDGRIELNNAGPNVSVIIQGATYNATTEPVRLDEDGISVAVGTSISDDRAYRFVDESSTLIGHLAGYEQALARKLELIALYPASSKIVSIDVTADCTEYVSGDSRYASVSLLAKVHENAPEFVKFTLFCQDDFSNHYAVLYGGPLFINETSNANQTLGLTINQGAADDEILSLKSSDVAHGMTDNAETDTWLAIQKAEATSGGANVIGYKDADGVAGFALVLTGRLGEAADTTKTTAGIAPVVIRSQVKSGTDVTDVGADGNLAVIRNGSTTRFIFDAEGSAHADIEWTTFDDQDDVAVLDTLEQTILAWQDPVKAGFGDFLQEQRVELEELGIVHFDDDNPGHAMVNTTRLSMLLVGAIRQVNQSMKQLEARWLN